jgi:hypothetical protein
MEVNLDAAIIQVGVSVGVVNQFGQLRLPHLRRAVAENEKKSINGIRFAGTIGPNNSRERLQ